MTDANNDDQGTCAFCGCQGRLRESHVLPAFVYRWLRGRAGHIRQTDNPNQRVQDGLKVPSWLCDDCEGQFSRYETAFATKLFYPWHEGNHTVAYGDWLLKFCVSVSWRVLRFARGHNKSTRYSDEQLALLTEAEACWRAFLKGEVLHPGAFEQHLLIFDIMESTTIPDLPVNFNRFMTRTVTLDIVGSERSLMTFAKLGRFMIFGIIQSGTNRWAGTKVHVKHGVIKPDKFTMPAGLLDLFREKAKQADMAMDTMSSVQRDKVDQHILANLDAFLESDQFASVMADAQMFGMDAVVHKEGYL
jgi:hypothetical protein